MVFNKKILEELRLFTVAEVPKNLMSISKMTKFKNPPTEIILHCSDSNSRRYGALAINRDHKTRFWVDKRGKKHYWAGIGYHFVIENDTLFVGRPLKYEGSHCRGHNHNSIGICVIGKNSFRDSQAMILSKLLEHFGCGNLIFETKQKMRVVGHRTYDTRKTCPNFCVDYFLATGVLWEYTGYKQ